MAEKRYEFTITLSGIGKNPEEAWNSATESFCMDSGICPEDYKSYNVGDD